MFGNNLIFKDFIIDYDKIRGGKVIYWSDRGIDLKIKERFCWYYVRVKI